MSKGKDFERSISKDMSLWLTHGTNADLIWYTKSSGGRATRRVNQNQQSSKYDFGDLGPDDASIYYFFDTFSCELKTGYGKKHKGQTTLWSVTDMVDSSQTTPLIYDFWCQAMNDANDSQREPLLIFRRNRRTACIAMRTVVFDIFKINADIKFDYITVHFESICTDIVICNLSYFFDATWGIIDENFIKLKVNRQLLLEKNYD